VRLVGLAEIAMQQPAHGAEVLDDQRLVEAVFRVHRGECRRSGLSEGAGRDVDDHRGSVAGHQRLDAEGEGRRCPEHRDCAEHATNDPTQPARRVAGRADLWRGDAHFSKYAS
jgi:hypothetical protein